MQAQTPPKGKFTVAVLKPPGSPAPERLLAALSAKGIATIDVGSSYAALAEACTLRAAPLGPDGRRPGSGVVLVFPEQIDDSKALLEALWMYAPGTRCWAYGPRSNPRLTPVVEQVATDLEVPLVRPAAAESGRGSPQRAAAGMEPKLKLTEPGFISLASGRSDDEEEAAPSGESRARRPLLSAEELSMLLGEDSGDEEKA